MKTAADYLDMIKEATGDHSDYAVSKRLGLTRSAISKYRNGISHFDAEVACKVSEILGIPEGEILAHAALFRAKTQTEKAAWEWVIQRLGGVAATVAIAVTLVGASPQAEAATDIHSASSPSHFLLCKDATQDQRDLGQGTAHT